MVKALKPLALFLFIAVAIYVGAFLILAHVPFRGKPLIFRTAGYYKWPGGTSWASFKEFDPKEHRDAVIVGSSHAYRGYDPFVFGERGYRVFNLGTSSQTPLNTLPIIKHFLDSAHCPVLIMDVYEGSFHGPGLESTADLSQNQPSDGAAWDMAWALRDLRGLNMMALRLLSNRSKPYYEAPEYKGLGFCTLPDSIRTAAPEATKDTATLWARQRYFFEECVRLCKLRGIRMVVSSHYERRDRRGVTHQALAAYMDSVLAGTGVPYLDFTDDPAIEDRNWFKDNNHLNTAGARIFTGHLVDSLEALGVLSHKRVVLPLGPEKVGSR